MKRYTTTGLWVEQKDLIYTIGLSEKGQFDVGDVIYADFPTLEKDLTKGDTILGVEGAKAVTDFTMPFDGQLLEIHSELSEEPEKLNNSAAEDNWIIKVTNVNAEDFKAIPAEMEAIEED